MTRQKEEFIPNNPDEVKIYACGPTVYNYIHIGNARPLCVFDVLRRYLEYRGYNVKFVQNFTDVDDKIIKRANEEGITFEEVSKKYIEEFWTDLFTQKQRKILMKLSILLKRLKKKDMHTLLTVMYISELLNLKNTVNSATSLSKICNQAQELQLVKRKKILLILHFGKLQKRVNLIGILLGAKADRAGILNVLQ